MSLEITLSLILGILSILTTLIMLRDRIFNGGKKEKGIESRVNDLEKGFTNVCGEIKTIKDNHLAHIEKDINNINVELAGINKTLEFFSKYFDKK